MNTRVQPQVTERHFLDEEGLQLVYDYPSTKEHSSLVFEAKSETFYQGLQNSSTKKISI